MAASGEQGDPQASATDEVEMAEIDDQMPLAAADVFHDDRLERTGVHTVQPSNREQHEYIVISFFRNFDIHPVTPAGGWGGLTAFLPARSLIEESCQNRQITSNWGTLSSSSTPSLFRQYWYSTPTSS